MSVLRTAPKCLSRRFLYEKSWAYRTGVLFLSAPHFFFTGAIKKATVNDAYLRSLKRLEIFNVLSIGPLMSLICFCNIPNSVDLSDFILHVVIDSQ